MKGKVNRRIVLAARPVGAPRDSDFALTEAPVPQPEGGQILLRTRFLSLDPYMRSLMGAGTPLIKPVDLGEVMVGGTVSEIVISRNDRFQVGDIVLAQAGWQEWALSDGRGVTRVKTGAAPVSTALGVLGVPGRTAYTGLLAIGDPKPGETVVVSSASGAIGSAVGQIARIKGARAVGIAGGKAKCAHVVNELGFDACIDRHDVDFPAALAAACPNGIDVYFENVGGVVWDAVLPLLNPLARVPVCGLISQYNEIETGASPDHGPALMRLILGNRLTIRGFFSSDFPRYVEEFGRDMAAWVAEGKIRYHEDVIDGLAAAPRAFIELLSGRRHGKVVVRIDA